MKINNLTLTNYRNHLKFKTEFTSDLVSIIGPNGIGKTNILESIYLLSTAKSPRAKYDADLVNYEKGFCTINSLVMIGNDASALELQIIKKEETEHTSNKRVKVNKVPKTVHYFCGIFNSVLFMPEDIQLITGPPSERRKYMDAVLVQIDGTYKRILNSYTKAVRQRNKILEKINKERRGWDEIGYWTEQVLKNGISLQIKREEMLNKMAGYLIAQTEILNGEGAKVEIIYKKSEINAERLERLQDREIAAKTTLIGPHRDDFLIELNSHNVAEFGSRGQQRGIILGLKLSEIEIIKSVKGENPVLLLDDIFSELDEKHQKAVLNVIDKQQTIITSTEILKFGNLQKSQQIIIG
jgi:DNA replication and repair protein RecF